MNTPTEPPERIGPYSLRDLRIVSSAALLAICAFFAIASPGESNVEMIDHTLFTMTVDEMRTGTGYYEAMELAFAEVYGPDRANVTETVIGFRPPTTFVMWRWLPSDNSIWLTYIGLTAAAGLLITAMSTFPPSGFLVSTYLLTNGVLRLGDVFVTQFTATEFWAVPVLVGSVASALAERWWLAAALGLAAFSVRETTLLIVLVGCALAVVGRVPKRPWFAALGAAVVLYYFHAKAALEFIDPTADTPLVSRAIPGASILRMVAFGLPVGSILGPILWVGGLRRLWDWNSPEKLVAMAPLLLPLIGLLVERRYWGLLVVPFSIWFGTEQLAVWVGAIRRLLISTRVQRAVS